MQANWKVAVKIFGAFEVFVVLMIVLGDGLGGTLYLLTLVFEIFFLLWGKLAAGSIAQWDNLQLAEVKTLKLSSPGSPHSSASVCCWPAPTAKRRQNDR